MFRPCLRFIDNRWTIRANDDTFVFAGIDPLSLTDNPDSYKTISSLKKIFFTSSKNHSPTIYDTYLFESDNDERPSIKLEKIRSKKLGKIFAFSTFRVRIIYFENQWFKLCLRNLTQTQMDSEIIVEIIAWLLLRGINCHEDAGMRPCF